MSNDEDDERLEKRGNEGAEKKDAERGGVEAPHFPRSLIGLVEKRSIDPNSKRSYSAKLSAADGKRGWQEKNLSAFQ